MKSLGIHQNTERKLVLGSTQLFACGQSAFGRQPWKLRQNYKITKPRNSGSFYCTMRAVGYRHAARLYRHACWRLSLHSRRLNDDPIPIVQIWMAFLPPFLSMQWGLSINQKLLYNSPFHWEDAFQYENLHIFETETRCSAKTSLKMDDMRQ